MESMGVYQTGTDTFYAIEADWASPSFATLKDYKSAYDKTLSKFKETFIDTVQQKGDRTIY